MGDQNRKSILEMSTRAQNKKRREWRTAQRNKRKRDRDLNKSHNSALIQEFVVRRAECMRRPGKKKRKGTGQRPTELLKNYKFLFLIKENWLTNGRKNVNG